MHSSLKLVGKLYKSLRYGKKSLRYGTTSWIYIRLAGDVPKQVLRRSTSSQSGVDTEDQSAGQWLITNQDDMTGRQRMIITSISFSCESFGSISFIPIAREPRRITRHKVAWSKADLGNHGLPTLRFRYQHSGFDTPHSCLLLAPKTSRDFHIITHYGWVLLIYA